MVAQLDKVFDVGETELEIMLLRGDSAVNESADDIGGLMNVDRSLIDGLMRG